MKGVRTLLLLLLFSVTIIQPFTLAISIEAPISSIPALNPLSKSVNSVDMQDGNPNPSSIPLQQKTLVNGNAPRNWTILIYMAADNDLQTTAFADIKEMEMVGSTKQVNIIVFVDFLTDLTGYGPGAVTFNITKDTEPQNNTIISTPMTTPLPAEPNMGDPTTLLAFIQFGQNHSQAEKYLLILWGVGHGYLGTCNDITDGNDRLLPHEIITVLENDTIEPINILAFDASFMGQIELAYEIQESVDFIVFSESEIPQQRLPYNKFLYSLTILPESNSLPLAEEIVNRYIEAYSPGGQYADLYTVLPSTLSLSVINTTELVPLISWFNQTIDYLLTPSLISTFYASLCAARGYTQQFSIPNFIDLGCFAFQIFLQPTNPYLASLAYNLSNAIDIAVVYQRTTQGVQAAKGLSINLDNYEPIALSLLNDTQYETFITQFQSIGETKDIPILPVNIQSLFGYLDGKNDSVYYLISPGIAAQYTIRLEAFQPYETDFDLYLYDSRMNLLTRSVELGSNEIVQYAMVPGQFYFVRAFSYPNTDITFGLGSIKISVITGSPVNPITFVIIAGIVIALVALIAFIIFLLYQRRYQIAEYLRRRRRPPSEPETIPVESSESPGTRTCAKCGEELPEEAKFCPKCGETFEESTEPDEPEEN
jgi:hypothetical protein